ncbi:MAG: hypothetical protein HW421_1885 [Ignavibacteria bacterium]|nr:hypothetical protein [Ignavibacteria bacterium]
MRDSLLLSDKLNEIRMCRQSDGPKSLILVEGNTDVKLFRKLLSDGETIIVPVEGFENLEKILEILKTENYIGLIGIRDSDFAKVEKFYKKFENLFYTDYHDIEISMINSICFDNIVLEHISMKKYQKFLSNYGNLKEVIFDKTYTIGLLKFYNYKNKLVWKFNNINFKKFINKDSLDVNIDNLIKDVEDKSIKLSIDKSHLKIELKKLSKHKLDNYQISNGHDFISILSIAFQKAIASKNHNELNPERIEESLRICYRLEDFKTTELYKSLKNWESINKPYLIF